jgi:hypothetical protein
MLDGVRWSAVLRGAVLDNVLTVVASVPLAFLLAGEDGLAEDPEQFERTLDQAVETPEFLLWAFVVGLAITVYAAYWASRRAGVLHLRHGGWTAVASLALASLFLLVPGATEGSAAPAWYDALSIALMLPAGVLGGWIAAKVDGAPIG